MRTHHLSLPRGDAGTLATVRVMRTMVRKARTSPVVRYRAVDIIRGIAGRDYGEQIFAIKGWLTEHVSFVRDPTGTELLIAPEQVLDDLAKGVYPLRLDCDDVAVLGASLGQAIGLRARFVVVGFSPRGPYRHVWTELSAPRADAPWHDLDITRGAQGLAHQQVQRTMIAKV